MKVYFAADHAGFELKGILIQYVRGLGFTAEDCGAHLFEVNDDYPGIIKVAAQKLSDDVIGGFVDSRAIVLGASGQGEAMVANRFKGVRCALYYGPPSHSQVDAAGKELDMLSSTRVHNDANALSLGARFLSEDDAKKAVKKWLETSFVREERHVRRIWQIDAQ